MATIREVLYQHMKGVSGRQIAKSFNICRKTLRRYLKLAKERGFSQKSNDAELNDIAVRVHDELYKQNNSTRSPAMTSLAKYKEEISNWLQAPNITNTQIQRLLLVEGLSVSTRSIDRFVSRHFGAAPKYTIHITTKPGQEGQVDFGYVGMMKYPDGKLRKTYAFVMTLSHSRYRYVEFCKSQDQLSWTQLHINAFKFFGGVPGRIILDNLKAGVIKSDIYDPTLNETYSELSRFYGFIIDPAKAYKPEHKGKVERSIRIVKEQLIAGVEYVDIEAANIAALKWCQYEISHRICSSTGFKPIDMFILEEQDSLIPLPYENFDLPIWTRCKVHADHHFIAKGNFYSVPTKYIGEEISVRIGLKTVSAYYKNIIIKTHPKDNGKGQWITDEKDYPESVLHYLENNPDKCLEAAKIIGESTYHLITKIISSGSRIGLRKSQAILRLAEKYSNERLEATCLRAVTYNNYAYKAISNILKNNLDQESIGSSDKPLDKRLGEGLDEDLSAVSDKSAKVKKSNNIKESAYIRNPEEYSSDMEVNYA